MPTQAASSASAPQIVASQPIPIDITATKALTIEIAKVPDGKPFDPHWTTYVQVWSTPVVAAIAAVIAATIQYRQWRTAQEAAKTARNKLKLDLFERRLTVYNAATQLLGVTYVKRALSDEDTLRCLRAVKGARWLFNLEVEAHLDQLAINFADREKLRPKSPGFVEEDGTGHIYLAMDLAGRTIEAEELQKLDSLLSPFMQLEH